MTTLSAETLEEPTDDEIAALVADPSTPDVVRRLALVVQRRRVEDIEASASWAAFEAAEREADRLQMARRAEEDRLESDARRYARDP